MESFQELRHLFYDHHIYEIRTGMQNRFLGMLLANLVATLITNPLDVCLTKLMT